MQLESITGAISYFIKLIRGKLYYWINHTYCNVWKWFLYVCICTFYIMKTGKKIMSGVMLEFGCNNYNKVQDVFPFKTFIPRIIIYIIFGFLANNLHSYHCENGVLLMHQGIVVQKHLFRKSKFLIHHYSFCNCNMKRHSK